MNLRQKLGQYYYNRGLLSFFFKPIVFVYDIWRHRIISDEKFLKNRFKRRMGYKLDLKNPKTLNEKIQWLKLYDRTPLHTICADKIGVRNHVKNIIGQEYLVPLLDILDNPKELKHANMPNKPFIIKTNHDSGSYKIIRNKDDIKNWDKIRKFFNKSLNTNYYYKSKEWQYKNIPPKVFIEELLITKEGEIPKDYKFHCFNGSPEYIQLDFERGSENHSRNWYDKNWNRAEFHWAIKKKNGKETLPNNIDVPKPTSLNKMLELAKKLSEPFSYVRVDFYLVDEIIYFGEITFHHDSGFRPIIPMSWDYNLGNLVNLPS